MVLLEAKTEHQLQIVGIGVDAQVQPIVLEMPVALRADIVNERFLGGDKLPVVHKFKDAVVVVRGRSWEFVRPVDVRAHPPEILMMRTDVDG